MKNLDGKQNSTVFSNLYYSVGKRRYPVCILGGDRFLDWFSTPPPIQLTTNYTFKIMKLSYKFGVRGFDISCRFNLINAFKQLKKYFPDVVGIGNPNWLCGYKLDNVPLWNIKDRIISTIVQKLKNKFIEKSLTMIPETHRFRFLTKKKNAKPLTDDEIQRISIDEKVWFNKINLLKGLTDFCLIGADYADWMCILNRLDLLKWQIKTVRKSGMVPVSVSHLASITLPLLDKEDFEAHWIYANRVWMYLDPDSAIKAIQTASKPITAFKILSYIKLPEEIESTIQWLKNFGVKSFVIGLETEKHVKETLPKIIKTLKNYK